VSLPRLRRLRWSHCRFRSLLPSPRLPPPPPVSPLFLPKKKSHSKSHQSAAPIITIKFKLIETNPWILLCIFLEVIWVEPVALQEAPALPRRRRRGARRCRGGCNGKAANGGSNGYVLKLSRVPGLKSGKRRTEGGGWQSGGRHRRGVARARARPIPLSPGPEGIREVSLLGIRTNHRSSVLDCSIVSGRSR